MHYTFNIRKSAQTTHRCPDCGTPLMAERSCFSARMRCVACERIFPVEQFIPVADAVLEEFLDGLYIDRI